MDIRVYQNRGQQTFSVNDKIVNVLDFASCDFYCNFVTPPLSTKAATDNA